MSLFFTISHASEMGNQIVNYFLHYVFSVISGCVSYTKTSENSAKTPEPQITLAVSDPNLFRLVKLPVVVVGAQLATSTSFILKICAP